MAITDYKNWEAIDRETGKALTAEELKNMKDQDVDWLDKNADKEGNKTVSTYDKETGQWAYNDAQDSNGKHIPASDDDAPNRQHSDGDYNKNGKEIEDPNNNGTDGKPSDDTVPAEKA